MEQFAKLFDTPDGQLLVFLDETEDGGPAVTVIGAAVNGCRPRAAMSGWPDGEAGQQRGFDAIDQAGATKLAADFRKMAAGFAPSDNGSDRNGEDPRSGAEGEASQSGAAQQQSPETSSSDPSSRETI